MKPSVRLFLTLLFFTFPFFCSAQTCQDSLREPNPYYTGCFDPYYPVCGCDGVNYRNDCAAYYKGGLNYWTDGSCGDFDYNIDPTYVTDFLNLQVFMKKAGTISISIYDAYGHILYLSQVFVPETVSSQQAFAIPISEVSFLEFGVYIISVNLNGEQISKKFFNSSN